MCTDKHQIIVQQQIILSLISNFISKFETPCFVKIIMFQEELPNFFIKLRRGSHINIYYRRSKHDCIVMACLVFIIIYFQITNETLNLVPIREYKLQVGYLFNSSWMIGIIIQLLGL